MFFFVCETSSEASQHGCRELQNQAWASALLSELLCSLRLTSSQPCVMNDATVQNREKRVTRTSLVVPICIGNITTPLPKKVRYCVVVESKMLAG